MAGDPVDSLLMSLVEKEIPEGRQALLESHHNLQELAAYCKENYINSEEKAKALQETKDYASQSLASVAYQIHSLAVNVLQMMDQQTIQLQNLQSNANNTGLTLYFPFYVFLYISADKIFGSELDFRHFCPPKFCPMQLHTPRLSTTWQSSSCCEPQN